jgi:1-acyl-sn-glycerol-3-phosphate acyltransferase
MTGNNIKTVFSKIFQYFISGIIRLIMPLFYKLEVKGLENVADIKRPLLLVSNHKSYFDALAIAHALPFLSNAFPLNFAAKDELFKTSVQRWFFGAFGAFPIKKGLGLDASLARPKEILMSGGSLVFFPEGKCFRQETLGPAKIGVGALIQRCPNVTLLPVAIRGSYYTSLNLFKKRPKITVVFGTVFNPAQVFFDKFSNDDLQPVADSVMDRIADIYNSQAQV